MFCKVCGTEVQDGVAFCTSCGSKMQNDNASAGFDFSQGFQQPVESNAGAYQQPYQQPAVATAPKKNTGAIVGIIIAVLAVLGLATFWILKNAVSKDDDKKSAKCDGKYTLETIQEDGNTITKDMLATYGYSITLEVKGEKLYGDVQGRSVEGTVTYNGDKVSLDFGNGPAVGKYDSSAKTLKLDYNGTIMIFKKMN